MNLLSSLFFQISTDLDKKRGKECSTGQRFIRKEVTSYKIHTLENKQIIFLISRAELAKYFVNQEKLLTYLIYGWPLKYQKDEGKSSRNTDTNIKLGLIFRSISARLVTCTSTCPIIQYGLFGGITFEKIISDWIHVIWLFVFTMRWYIFWKLYFCTVYSSQNKNCC